MKPEAKYLNYNPCKVTINGNYVITNIQTQGIPGYQPKAHLESLTIKAPNVGSGNSEEHGASGTINVVDYKNSVFDVLNKRLVDYLNNNNDSNFLSRVQIHIDCWSGSKDWYGEITDWSYEFVGTTPQIVLNWKSIPNNNAQVASPPSSGGQEYKTPQELIKAVREASGLNYPFVDIDGNDISGKIKFNADKINFDINGIPNNSRNTLVDCYNYIIANSTLDGKVLAPGEVINDNGSVKYVVKFAEAEYNTSQTDDGQVSAEIVFIQNSSLPYYKRRSDSRYVVPMTSFNYNTQMSNMVLQSRVLYNVNGNVVQNINNGENKQVDPNSTPANAQTANAATGPSGIIVSFECYNVLSFSMNNTAEQVYYEVYDEFGQKSILSGHGTVTEVSYSLQGGVVKANVTCAEYFNKAETDESGTGGVPTDNDSSGDDADGSANIADAISSSADEAYFRQEDNKVIPLDFDKSSQLIRTKEFGDAITEFFDRGYGELEKDRRLLDFDYVENLIGSGNIALFTLLIAVANYGIKGIPEWANLKDDPVLHLTDFKNKSKFCASSGGKSPYDYTTGGLGIPHWDSGNYSDIYSTIGFDQSVKDDHDFMNILTTVTNPLKVANPKDVTKGKSAKFYDGKVIGFKDGQYNGIPRCFPITNGKCEWTEFDKGLKQNGTWTDWAYNILHFRDSNDKMVFQTYLFTLWVTKFWEPTIGALKKVAYVSSSNGHIVNLQDAVRISRMGNSAGSLIAKSAGKSVSEQLDIYLDYRPAKATRYLRQFAFCKRAAYILENLVKY